MKTVIFVGPSLPAARARELAPAAALAAPARCGDVYRAAVRGAHTIGLIDGFFEHALSVWHKEILWALSNGVRVYGAASMGALRAAELARFGMIGVGTIYEWYRRARVEDDDEVALVHEPAERGYVSRSIALVNLRATFEKAEREGVLSAEECDGLIAALKGLFYPRRDLHALRSAVSKLLPPQSAARFERWFAQTGLVDQKRIDAEAMLQRLTAEAGAPAKRPGFRLAETDAWHTLRKSMDSEERKHAEGRGLPQRPLRPEPPRGAAVALEPSIPLQRAEVRFRAAERALASVLARNAGSSWDAASVQRESEKFRRERGLLTADDMDRWLSARGLDIQAFSQLVYDNLVLREFEAKVRALVSEQVPNVLANLHTRPEDAEHD